MRRSILAAVCVALVVALCASICGADSMWDYEVVGTDGTHPMVTAPDSDPNNKVVIEGVALAGYNEILDPSSQYTVFLQDTGSDRGGMQAWTGKFLYGDPTNGLWDMLRLTDYVSFQAGDRLRITGFLADMGRGKVVINNRGHQSDLALVWHVDVLGHDGLPDPELIPSVANCNYFDQTRADGGERYQTRYTMLHGVEITARIWGNNKHDYRRPRPAQ